MLKIDKRPEAAATQAARTEPRLFVDSAADAIHEVIVDTRAFGVTTAEAQKLHTLAAFLEAPAGAQPRRVLRDSDGFGRILNYYRNVCRLPPGMSRESQGALKLDADFWGCPDLITEIKQVYPKREAVRANKGASASAQRAAADLRALAVALAQHQTPEYGHRKLAKAQAVHADPRLDIPFYEVWRARTPQTMPATAWQALGAGYAATGDHTSSLAAFVASAQAPGDEPHRSLASHRGRGEACLALQNHGGAEAAFREVLRIDDGDSGALFGLGQALRYRDNLAAARDSLGQAVALAPERGDYHAGLAAVHALLGDDAAATESYRLAVQHAPEQADYHTALAEALTRVGDRGGAILAYRRALELRPNEAALHDALCASYQSQGDHVAALEHAKRATELVPSRAISHFHLGFSHLELHANKSAVQALARACELDPDLHGAHYNLGTAHLALKSYEAAVSAYARAIELSPNDAGYINGLGCAYHDKGDHEAALRLFMRAAELAPNEPAIRNNMVLSLKGQEKYAEAVVECRRAIELAPQNFEFRHEIGTLYMKQGRWAEAVDALARALEIEPGNAVARAALEEAKTALKKATKWGPLRGRRSA